MNFVSNNAQYDMDLALEELNQKKIILDVKAETQVILQLMVSKGIVTREEVSAMRETVKNSPAYKPMYDYINSLEKDVQYYKQHQEEHLKAVFQAKMDGKIK